MLQSFALSLLAVAPVTDPESQFSYTYADLSYVQTDVDGVSEHIEGFDFEGSFDLGHRFRLFTGYRDSTLDLPGASTDLEQIQVGVGYYNSNEWADVVLDVAYIGNDTSIGGASMSNDGYRVGVDFRFMVYEQFEFDFGVAQFDIDGVDGTCYEFEGIYSVTRNLGIIAGYDILDDADTISLGVRLQGAPGSTLF